MNDSGFVQIPDAAQNLEIQGFFDLPIRFGVVADPIPQLIAGDEFGEDEKIFVNFPTAKAFDDELGRDADARLALDALNQGRLIVAVQAAFFNQQRDVDMLERVIFRLLQVRRPPNFAEAALADFIFHQHGLRLVKLHVKARVFRKIRHISFHGFFPAFF